MRRFCAQLATPEGRDHIRLTFQITIRAPMRRNLLIDDLEDPWDTSLAAETALIRESLPDVPDAVVRERAVAGLLFILLQVAERARIVDDEDDTQLLDEEDFVTNLIDMTTAALTAPVTSCRHCHCRQRRRDRNRRERHRPLHPHLGRHPRRRERAGLQALPRVEVARRLRRVGRRHGRRPRHAERWAAAARSPSAATPPTT